jgi:hypothetical protein
MSSKSAIIDDEDLLCSRGINRIGPCMENGQWSKNMNRSMQHSKGVNEKATPDI